MAFEPAGRRLRPAGDPGLGRRRRGVRRAERRRAVRARRSSSSSTTRPRAAGDGPRWAASASSSELAWTHQRAATSRCTTQLIGHTSTDGRRGRGPRPDAVGGLTVCGIAGCYQQRDGKARRDTMIDRLAPPRAGRRAASRDRRRRRPPSCLGAPPAVDHRPVDGGRPAVRQGRPDAQLQRRALQLPRAAGRAARRRACASRPAPTPRWCSRPGGAGARTACGGSAACSRSRSSTSAPAA